VAHHFVPLIFDFDWRGYETNHDVLKLKGAFHVGRSDNSFNLAHLQLIEAIC